MKENIELTEIKTKDNRIQYTLVDNSGMALLKSPAVHAWIQFDHTEEFELDLSRLPLSVLAIPMSLYLLPITYYYPVELRIPVMDKMLHENLPAMYSAYAKIYGTLPQEQLYKRGGVYMNSIEENTLPSYRGFEKVVFFSGGVDACSAGVNNPGARNVLASIPSIESKAKNEGALRKEKYALIKDFSQVSGSPWALIFNNFNDDVYNEIKIKKHLASFLTSDAFKFDGWHGIKYLANMSCAAPLAYALGIPSLVMGSTFEQLEEKKSANYDGANPELSDSIKYAGIHFAEQDELYTRRQKKTENVIKWCNARNTKIRIWVCFDDKPEQCGVCNKCVRTQLNILICGENPKDWGFALFNEKKFSRLIMSYRYWESNPCWVWDNIDAIEDGRKYPCCNEMLHWLKKVGYKEYVSKSKKVMRNRNIAKALLRINRYPRYAKKVCMRLLRKEGGQI